MLKYTDMTQNTYIQSSTVTEIMAREKCGLAFPRTAPVQLTHYVYTAHVLESGMHITHYTRHVREYLKECFPNRWLGRGGPVAWPPRSPDLTPLDYYLWGPHEDVSV